MLIKKRLYVSGNEGVNTCNEHVNKMMSRGYGIYAKRDEKLN